MRMSILNMTRVVMSLKIRAYVAEDTADLFLLKDGSWIDG